MIHAGIIGNRIVPTINQYREMDQSNKRRHTEELANWRVNHDKLNSYPLNQGTPRIRGAVNNDISFDDKHSERQRFTIMTGFLVRNAPVLV